MEAGCRGRGASQFLQIRDLQKAKKLGVSNPRQISMPNDTEIKVHNTHLSTQTLPTNKMKVIWTGSTISKSTNLKEANLVMEQILEGPI